MKNDTSTELNIELYKKLYLIRRSEQKIIELYHENDMKTPMHMSMGEEAITVGVCHALTNDDMVLGTYRSHAAYLAKTQDVNNFFAEMYGKDTAFLKGKGGSMHLSAPDQGFLGTSAIVASSIPVACGAAFANKHVKNGKTVVSFFGDGAIDEGSFWESLNVACLMRLPIVFVCEDNGWAVHTPPHTRHGYESITRIVSEFRCQAFQEDSTDVEVIYRLAKKAVDACKSGDGPVFLDLKYYRYLEHVGINEDFDAGYRSRAEFEKWVAKDPIAVERSKLVESGLSEREIKTIEDEVDALIERSVASAKAAPFSDPRELFKEVYHEEDYLL